MVFRFAKSAERRWRKLDCASRLSQLIENVEFRNGEPIQDAEDKAAAQARAPRSTIARAQLCTSRLASQICDASDDNDFVVTGASLLATIPADRRGVRKSDWGYPWTILKRY